jgi:alpha-glucosidase
VLFSPSRPRRPDAKPAPLRRTTFGHELALSVVFESGLQHFPDAVEAYEGLPPEAKEILRDVPANWDETRLLEGEPGKLVVLARRHGETWYVAGINGEGVERHVLVSQQLRGLREALLLTDGETDTSFAIGRPTLPADLTVRMRPRGGFVLRVTPAPSQNKTVAARRPAASPANPPRTPPMQ